MLAREDDTPIDSSCLLNDASQAVAGFDFRRAPTVITESRAKKPLRPDAPWREITIDHNGQPRQAGATTPEGAFIHRFRTLAERSLYVFGKGVMGRHYLTKHLHLPICLELQQVPPFRKLRLLPRDHAKTSLVGHCLPPHILIQPRERNIYIKGLAGTDSRIMLAGETQPRAKNNLRVVATALESNRLLRALWPQVAWENPRRDAKKWNDTEIILPREHEYPDPSVFAIGVGGAIAGARPNIVIKDDLISLNAANSEIEMEAAIKWHIASRALMDEYEKDTGVESLEYIIGTRWAVFDLYSFIIEGGIVEGERYEADPTVDVVVRAIVEDGQSIWPERFDAKRIEQLRRDNGSMFWLLYMNSVANPELTDFHEEKIRSFTFTQDSQALEFTEDERDHHILKRLEEADGQQVQHVTSMRGQRLTPDTWGALFGMEKGRKEWLRLKYG